MASGFNIFKQKVLEKFDNERKTQDASEFMDRVKNVNTNEKRIMSYMDNAKEWIESTADIMTGHIAMSNAIFMLYENTEYQAQATKVNYEIEKLQL
jgi:hypothetical protein